MGIQNKLTLLPNEDMLIGAFVNSYLSTFTRGEKFFELSNHLGNVLVTISDKKIGHDAGNGTIDYYTADVVTATDYYPGGMGMPGRKYSPGNSYRYGFNGKENDNEVKGEGNQQDYGMRIYDPRLGRFLSVDPITTDYPELTPYQFASNRPIDGIDLDGLEYLSSNESIITIGLQVTSFNGKSAISGSVFISSFKNVRSATADYLKKGGNGRVAVFKSPTYEDIILQRDKAAAEALRKTPSPDDANPESITQPEIYTKVIPKNKAEARAQQREKKFWEPSGVKSGSAKGDALIAAVQLTSDIMKFNHGRYIDNDFEDAQKQLWAVQSVVDNVQFGLDNNVFAPADMDNLFDYANYLLDGTKPQMNVLVGYTNTGGEIRKEVDDNRKIKKFEQYTNKIGEKRREREQQAQNTTTATGNN